MPYCGFRLMQTPDLSTLGWSSFFDEQFGPFRDQGFEPARVALEHQHIYRVYTGRDEPLAHGRRPPQAPGGCPA